MIGAVQELLSLIRWDFIKSVVKARISDPTAVVRFNFGIYKMDATSRIFPYLFKDIFIFREYDMELDPSVEKLSILDIGANFGASVVFFKSIFPNSEITAFEADPSIFKHLYNNVALNSLEGVHLINKAAWTADTSLNFVADGGGGGRVDSQGKEARSVPASVEAIDLNQWLKGKQFHILKMDVEGAETKIIPHCAEEIARIPCLMFEYHSDKSESQNLGEIVSFLEQNGYRYWIKSINQTHAPLKRKMKGRFDNQMNIYARKSTSNGQSGKDN